MAKIALNHSRAKTSTTTWIKVILAHQIQSTAGQHITALKNKATVVKLGNQRNDKEQQDCQSYSNANKHVYWTRSISSLRTAAAAFCLHVFKVIECICSLVEADEGRKVQTDFNFR